MIVTHLDYFRNLTPFPLESQGVLIRIWKLSPYFSAYIPFEQHNITDHARVLLYWHPKKDLIGVKLRVLRGVKGRLQICGIIEKTIFLRICHLKLLSSFNWQLNDNTYCHYRQHTSWKRFKNSGLQKCSLDSSQNKFESFRWNIAGHHFSRFLNYFLQKLKFCISVTPVSEALYSPWSFWH